MWTSEYIERSKAVEGLAAILHDWEEAADGKPLDLVYGSIGLLFEDVCCALDIQVEELQSQVKIG